MLGFRFSSLPSLTALAAFCIGLAPSPSLLAQVHVEIGDAGELPASAQMLNAGPVSSIQGTLGTGDRDMFIFNTAGGTFSATVVAPISADGDSQLFLFDSTGRGIFANDDYLVLSGPSRITADLAAGQYFLAISSFDDDPINGPLFTDLIFPTFPADELMQVGPFVPGGPPISGWNDLGGDGFSYTINLTNAFGAPPTGGGNGNGNGSTVPDVSSSLVLLSLGMLTVVTMRRRFRG
jgi:hypothetical protein